MVLYTLYIVNKAGGLIYNKVWWLACDGACTCARERFFSFQDLSQGLPKLDGNEYLRLASTFHSLHAIAKQIAPVESQGIVSVDAQNFSLHCYETITGMKIFVTAKPGTPNVQQFLKKVYEFYTDYVLKNPFYEMDMPIRVRVSAPWWRAAVSCSFSRISFLQLFDLHVEGHVNFLGYNVKFDEGSAKEIPA